VELYEEEYQVFSITKLNNVLTLELKNLQKNIPSRIKIKSNIINQQIYNNKHSRDISIISINKNYVNSSNYLFWKLDRKIFFPIANTIISNIDITITDEYNRQLYLNPGTATIIQLTFKKMPIYNKSFIMYIKSDPTKEYQNNRPCKFKVNLPKVYNFSPNWKMGLSKIHFINSFNTFPEDVKNYFIITNENDTFKFEIPNQKYTTKSLFDLILNESNKINLLSITKNDKNIITLKSDNNLIVTISKHLAHVLGYDIIDNIEENDISFQLTQTEPITMPFKLNTNYFNPSYLMIYCNIINPISVSDGYRHLLAIINCSRKQNEFNEYEVKNILYHSLLYHEIEDIEIEIRSQAGDLISFEKPSNIIIDLNFQNYL
jgi:hypothetical protein